MGSDGILGEQKVPEGYIAFVEEIPGANTQPRHPSLGAMSPSWTRHLLPTDERIERPRRTSRVTNRDAEGHAITSMTKISPGSLVSR